MAEANWPRLLTLREAAARLEASETSVRRRIADGQLDAVQLGGPGTALRIAEDALKRFVYGDPQGVDTHEGEHGPEAA